MAERNRKRAAQGLLVTEAEEALPAGRGATVPVLLPFPFAGPFDYRVPRAWRRETWCWCR